MLSQAIRTTPTLTTGTRRRVLPLGASKAVRGVASTKALQKERGPATKKVAARESLSVTSPSPLSRRHGERGSQRRSLPMVVRSASAAGENTFEDIPESELSIVEPVGVGLRRDLKARLPSYLSDYKDGLNLKCLASTLFMFFACLAPAVAFGSLLSVKTAGAMGALEMLVSTSICGMVYAIFSGQPVTIIGSTGPVLAFTAIMYSTCIEMSLPFLSTVSHCHLSSLLIIRTIVPFLFVRAVVRDFECCVSNL